MTLARRERRRRAVVAVALSAAVVTAAVVVLAIVILGGRAGSADDGALRWAGRPMVMQAPSHPRERTLVGTVRNSAAGPVEVEASDVRVLDESGHPLRSSAIFLGSFARGIYGASRIDQASDFERRRTGRLARIGARSERPLTVSWRLEPGSPRAARVVYPGGSLPIPR